MKRRTIKGGGRTLHIAICEVCGEPLKHCGSMAQRYCKDCGDKIRKQRTRERVAAYRARKKAE